MDIKENIQLAPYTSYRIGGPAKFFCIAENKEDLISAFKFAKKQDFKYHILGGGSNVLFSDKGFNGLIILNRFNKIEFNDNLVKVGTGTILSLFIKKAIENNLGGLENLFGIPGTIGGAIFQNAGAYGTEIGEFLTGVEILNKNGQIVFLSQKDLQLSYRDSIMKKEKMIALESTFQLQKQDKTKLAKLLNKIIENRKKPYGKSAGSFFKNPNSKISAGKLIDQNGLKGSEENEAKISEKHGNFILNTGDAKASDVINLSKRIKDIVLKNNKIELVEEVQIIPY